MEPARPNRPDDAAARTRRGRTSPSELSLAFGMFLGLVAVGGILSLALPATWWAPPERWLLALAVLTVLSVGLEFVSVPLPSGGTVSMSTMPHMALLLLVPPPFAALAIGFSSTIEESSRRAPFAKLVFNVGGMLLTASICSLVAGMVGSAWTTRGGRFGDVDFLVPVLAVGLTYYAVNALLTSVVFALAIDRSFWYVLRVNSLSTALSEAGATVLGALVAFVWTVEPLITPLLAVPGAVITRSFEHIQALRSQTETAVRSMAQIIDHRDTSTYHHSERVAVYAAELARDVGLSEDAVELIEQAASVHDLGKIGIPDRILLKPGPLTEAERTAMWLHTEIGARILEQFDLFRSGTEIVLHHHEAYDGSGYPAGLAGESIPFGARIVAIADAFDAMTADRPYRRALPVEEAVTRLREGAGKQWDASLVRAFVQLVEDGVITTTDGEDEVIAWPGEGDPVSIAPTAPPLPGDRIAS